MAKESAIEWTDATWNPWMGCTKVSAGCTNCYMFRDQKRYGTDPTEIRRSKTTFRDPLKWEEPRMIFVCSWSDFFHEDVPEGWRTDAWEIMWASRTIGHTFLLLTKRPENIAGMLPTGWTKHFDRDWDHIWLGVTAENQETADLRMSPLLQIPAAKHFVSVEPMLGFVDLRKYLKHLDWVIAGGESGTNYRDMNKLWVIDLRDECIATGTLFFFKQWSGLHPKKDPRGMILDGREWKETP